MSTPSSSVSAHETFTPPWAGFPPDFSLNDATASASSAVLMNPSPIRAARSSALGPNAET